MAPNSLHRVNICTMNPMSLGMFSFVRHLQTSTRKLTAAARGEYISSMMSLPRRMYSCGSSSHSSASTWLKHTI